MKTTTEQAAAPRLVCREMPDVEPGKFTRGDWILEDIAGYLIAIEKHVGALSAEEARWITEPEGPPAYDFKTVVVPERLYERMKRRSDAFDSLLEAFRKVTDVAWNRERARLRAVEAARAGRA